MQARVDLTEGMRLEPVSHLITQAAVDSYAEASGDFNPIHTDAEFAAGSHFGRRVAHGMMIAASLSELMSVSFGSEWARSGRMKLRFRSPVFPGERVVTSGTVSRLENLDGGSRLVTCRLEAVRCDPVTAQEQTAITGEATVVV